MKPCPSCQVKNVNKNVFCRACGSPMESPSLSQSPPQEETPKPTPKAKAEVAIAPLEWALPAKALPWAKGIGLALSLLLLLGTLLPWVSLSTPAGTSQASIWSLTDDSLWAFLNGLNASDYYQGALRLHHAIALLVMGGGTLLGLTGALLGIVFNAVAFFHPESKPQEEWVGIGMVAYGTAVLTALSYFQSADCSVALSAMPILILVGIVLSKGAAIGYAWIKGGYRTSLDKAEAMMRSGIGIALLALGFGLSGFILTSLDADNAIVHYGSFYALKPMMDLDRAVKASRLVPLGVVGWSLAPIGSAIALEGTRRSWAFPPKKPEKRDAAPVLLALGAVLILSLETGFVLTRLNAGLLSRFELGFGMILSIVSAILSSLLALASYRLAHPHSAVGK